MEEASGQLSIAGIKENSTPCCFSCQSKLLVLCKYVDKRFPWTVKRNTLTSYFLSLLPVSKGWTVPKTVQTQRSSVGDDGNVLVPQNPFTPPEYWSQPAWRYYKTPPLRIQRVSTMKMLCCCVQTVAFGSVLIITFEKLYIIQQRGCLCSYFSERTY